MPKYYCYLNHNTTLQLENIKQQEGYDSTSQVMKEMIALGIEVYEKNRNKSNENFTEKHTTYLLRLVGLSTDILRCIYDKNKLNSSFDNPEDHVSNIKKKVDSFIENNANKIA